MIDRDMIAHLEANGFLVTLLSPELQKAEGIIEACRSTTPFKLLPEGTVVKADLIRHLREGGLRIVQSDRIKKFGAQRSEDLRTFNFIQDGDALMRAIRSRMGADLGIEVMEQVGWAVTDEQGRRVFRTEVEVIV